MTRKDLSRAYLLNNEIRLLQEEIDKLEAEAKEPTAATMSDVKASGRKKASPTEQRVLKIAERKTKLEMKQLSLQLAKDEIWDFIESVDDSLMRQIIMCRCVKFYSWKKIATEMGGINSPDTLCKIYSRFVNERFKCQNEESMDQD